MVPSLHNGPGVFHVQYTDEASAQLARLDSHTCTAVQERLRVIASVDPYAHGRADQVTGRDRRMVDIENLVIIFWVSLPVRTLTVVSIHEGDTGPAQQQPRPPAPGVSRPGPFQGFTEDEEDEADVREGQFVRAGT